MWLRLIAAHSVVAFPRLFLVSPLQVSINKHFDDPMLLELARQDADLQQIL